jgi:branched-chain amino acid aminotransferase
VRVSPARQAKLYVVCSPVGNYFGNPKPVSLLADGRHVRAFPGGVGCFKLGWSEKLDNYFLI